MFWKRLRGQFKRKPFKGSFAYEWQIGPFVFYVYYPNNVWHKRWQDSISPGVGPFRVWFDEYWWKFAA